MPDQDEPDRMEDTMIDTTKTLLDAIEICVNNLDKEVRSKLDEVEVSRLIQNGLNTEENRKTFNKLSGDSYSIEVIKYHLKQLRK